MRNESSSPGKEKWRQLAETVRQENEATRQENNADQQQAANLKPRAPRKAACKSKRNPFREHIDARGVFGRLPTRVHNGLLNVYGTELEGIFKNPSMFVERVKPSVLLKGKNVGPKSILCLANFLVKYGLIEKKDRKKWLTR